jgi:putative membrane protein
MTDPPPSLGDRLATDRTRLALDRTRLAHERTLMAWVRTAASLISFGFTIDKTFGLLRQQQGGTPPSAIGARTFALMLIGIGLAALLLAAAQHRRDLTALRAEYGPVPYSLAAVVAVLVAGLGVLGFASVLLQF